MKNFKQVGEAKLKLFHLTVIIHFFVAPALLLEIRILSASPVHSNKLSTQRKRDESLLILPFLFLLLIHS